MSELGEECSEIVFRIVKLFLREGLEIACLGFAAQEGFRTSGAFGLFRRTPAVHDYHGEFLPIETLG